MPFKLQTLEKKIDLLPLSENVQIVKSFLNYMNDNGLSINHKINSLKSVFSFGMYINQKTFYEIKSKEEVLAFLNTKVKSNDDDPDKKWITTWNFYLNRLKIFYRWLYNHQKCNTHEDHETEWQTPSFIRIKNKQSKRLSPYSETEIWDKEEFLSIIKYEQYKRNKAALTLMWDLNARNHEVTLLRIKHIRLKERYGEGEIPFESKTGTGPILLTTSFPYVRDWLNEHPFKNEPNARLICNLHNGAPIKPEALHTMMHQLKSRILRLIETGEIKDKNEEEKLMFLINRKKFNPYCIRHSSISSDSDHLPEYALKKKVRWSMNSKQGSRYIKTRMGTELRNKILEYNGIITHDSVDKKPSILNCPRCYLTNALENKYCSSCSYPLKLEAFDEIKSLEDEKINALKQKNKQEMFILKQEMENKFNSIISLIQQNPLLAYIKPETLQTKRSD